MGTYVYTPLIPSDETIRLLALLPGTLNDDIRVAIYDNFLTWPQPEYEALSHAGGSLGRPVDIHVGRSGDATLSVTRDVATALRYLRLKHEERVLWVDAICVNQQDVNERVPQMQKMAQIYGNAFRVVAWLGPPSHDSIGALHLIKGFSQEICVDWETMTVKPSSGSRSRWAEPHYNPIYDSDMWTPLLNLLRRPWFNRLWTWQEVLLADTVILLCGFQSLDWEKLRDIMFCLHTKHQAADRSPREIEMAERVRRVHGIWRSRFGNTTFVDLLDWTGHCSYTDQRDRVYALQNLVSENELIVSMVPNYSQSPRAIFQDVVLLYLRGEQCLKLLSCCGRSSELPSKPTWVPDWSRDQICHSLPRCSYSASLAEAVYLGNGLLKAAGLCSTYVQWAEIVPPQIGRLADNQNLELIQAIRSLWGRVSPNSSYTGSGHMDEIFCRTLSASPFAEDYVPPARELPTLEKSKQFLANILGTGSGWNERYTPYLTRIISCIRGRSFMMTTEGYPAVGPKAAEPGDQICKILGCHSLLLLRSAESYRHTVIGECYVQDLMDEKALLGPFPPQFNYIRVQCDPDEYCYYPQFVDHLTANVVKVDPRLGPLPRGWRIADHEKMEYYDRYVNDATGEGFDYYMEPRMTGDALEKRGVHLIDFVLE